MKSERLIKLTSDLINFKTTEDNYKERKRIISFVKKQFKGRDFCIEEFDSNRNPSVVVTLRKSKKPSIFLNGHLDVVPARARDFLPVVKNGRIYGRGSGDMKAGCAVMIEVLKYFSKQKIKPSLGLMLTTDEEVGGVNGVGYLVEEKKYKPELVIIPDGGISLKTIVTHQKGILHLKVKAYGKSAHGSRPFLGKNAVERLINNYQGLRNIIPEIKKGEWKTTMNLGKIYGGETINRVPNYAEMHLDIRYAKKQNRSFLLKKIGNSVDEYEIITEGEMFVQDKRHQFIQCYREIIEKEIKEKIMFYKVEGASDARYFSQHNIPVIITKIGCANIHAENEWVDIKEMNIFYNTLIKFINVSNY